MKNILSEIYHGSYTVLNHRNRKGTPFVKTLDRIILACIAVILIVVALEMRNPGFTITFDSRGGSDVPAQNQMYGDLLEAPEPPTREGYTFQGWYKDAACDLLWNMEKDTVETDMTLYAGWQKNE